MILQSKVGQTANTHIWQKAALQTYLSFTGIFQRQSSLAQITMTSDLAVSLLLPAWSLSIKRK